MKEKHHTETQRHKDNREIIERIKSIKKTVRVQKLKTIYNTSFPRFSFAYQNQISRSHLNHGLLSFIFSLRSWRTLRDRFFLSPRAPRMQKGPGLSARLDSSINQFFQAAFKGLIFFISSLISLAASQRSTCC
jgi:hypothetical protein